MSRKAELAALALVLIVVTLFFSDVLFFGKSFYVRDLARIYYPERQILRDALTSGELPFWNPRFAAGQPLAANPTAEVFYPPQWLVLMPRILDGIRIEIVLHFLIAAAGMFLLLRALRLRLQACVFGAFTFALSGLMLSLANLLPCLFAMAWLPWLGLFARRFLDRGRIRDFAGAALTLGLILLIGEPSTILQSGALLLAYAIYRRRGVRGAAVAAAIGAAALLVGLAQIAPAIDHQRDSGRAERLPYDVVLAWSMSPARPLEIIAPDLFGRFSSDAIYFWASDHPSRLPWLFSFYFGLFAAALVIAGFIHRLRGWTFVAVVSAVGYLLAIGKHGPLFPLLYRCGLGFVRYPEKFFVVPAFLLIIFAAIAADRFLEDDDFRRTTLFTSMAMAIVAAGTVAFAWSPLFARAWRLAGDYADIVAEARAGATTTLVEAIALVLILALRKRRGLCSALLAIFVVIDLGVRVRGLAPRIDDRYYDPPPIARALTRRGGAVRIYNDADWRLALLQQPHIAYGSNWWRMRNGLLPEMEAMWGLGTVLENDVTLTNLRPSIEFSRLFWQAQLTGRRDFVPLLLAFAGVTDVIALRDATSADDPVRVVTLSNDRYYFADQLVAVNRLLEPMRWSRRVAFVDTPFTPAPARITAVRERMNSVDLDVESSGNAVLVLSITPHKYWGATIDGSPAQLYRANVGFQALTVPEGRHHVALRYRNPLVVICGIASLVAVLALVVIAVADGALRSRALRPPSPR